MIHTACAGSILPGFLGIWKFPENLLSNNNPRNARQLLPSERCLPLTTPCVDNDDGGMKVLALHFQELSTHLSIPGKQCSWWLMQTFPLKFIDRLKRNNADCYRQSTRNIASDFKTAWMCLTGSVSYPCNVAFQRVNRNWHNLSVATKVICRLPRELGACMHKQHIPGSLSFSLTQETGNEANGHIEVQLLEVFIQNKNGHWLLKYNSWLWNRSCNNSVSKYSIKHYPHPQAHREGGEQGLFPRGPQTFRGPMRL